MGTLLTVVFFVCISLETAFMTTSPSRRTHDYKK